MKKIFISLFLASFLFAGKLEIVATLPDLADIAKSVGGEKVSVSSICKGYQDPHYLQAKPSYSRKMRNVDLLIFNGLELEIGWLAPLINSARNPKIKPGKFGSLDCSEGIPLLEVPHNELDRSGGDVHPLGNPHYLLDPQNALIVAQTIATRLSQIDAENSEIYQKNFDEFRRSLELKIVEWEKQSEQLKGLQIVAYHKNWEYLADWLGLEIVGYLENRPGIPPSPKHLKSFVEIVNEQEIRVFLAATFVDVNQAKKAAERTETNLLILPALVGGVQHVDSYFELFDFLIQKLMESAQ
ncbi:MAG: zinc ABC transporter substrate-binding protein [Candidatus Marinimicrobia bacterium]|nr:zinc ABC transporter substrate-binding protein [Candidatus Neomarinimicrobiota bacterium]